MGHLFNADTSCGPKRVHDHHNYYITTATLYIHVHPCYVSKDHNNTIKNSHIILVLSHVARPSEGHLCQPLFSSEHLRKRCENRGETEAAAHPYRLHLATNVGHHTVLLLTGQLGSEQRWLHTQDLTEGVLCAGHHAGVCVCVSACACVCVCVSVWLFLFSTYLSGHLMWLVEPCWLMSWWPANQLWYMTLHCSMPTHWPYLVYSWDTWLQQAVWFSNPLPVRCTHIEIVV